MLTALSHTLKQPIPCPCLRVSVGSARIHPAWAVYLSLTEMAHLHCGTRGSPFVRQIQTCFGVVSTESVRGCTARQPAIVSKIRTNEIQYTWLEGKERSETDRRHEWKQPVATLHLPMHQSPSLICFKPLPPFHPR